MNSNYTQAMEFDDLNASGNKMLFKENHLTIIFFFSNMVADLKGLEEEAKHLLTCLTIHENNWE